MQREDTGLLVVESDAGLYGVISERDLVCTLANEDGPGERVGNGLRDNSVGHGRTGRGYVRYRDIECSTPRIRRVPVTGPDRCAHRDRLDPRPPRPRVARVDRVVSGPLTEEDTPAVGGSADDVVGEGARVARQSRDSRGHAACATGVAATDASHGRGVVLRRSHGPGGRHRGTKRRHRPASPHRIADCHLARDR